MVSGRFQTVAHVQDRFSLVLANYELHARDFAAVFAGEDQAVEGGGKAFVAGRCPPVNKLLAGRVQLLTLLLRQACEVFALSGGVHSCDQAS